MLAKGVLGSHWLLLFSLLQWNPIEPLQLGAFINYRFNGSISLDAMEYESFMPIIGKPLKNVHP